MSGTYEDQSHEFLTSHMDGSFRHIMSERIINRIEWLETSDCDCRPIAVMNEEDQNCESNLICLFPPFISEVEQ